MGLINNKFSLYKKVTEPVFKPPQSIQKSIGANRISKNGIFEIKEGELYDKAYLFLDTNYATKDEPEQDEFFTSYCKLLNSMSISWKIVIANNNKDMMQFKKNLLLAEAGDGHDIYRNEYNNIICERIEEGRKGIDQVKYFVVTAEKKDYESANAFFQMVENTMKTYFKELNSGLIPLSGIERLRSLHNFYCLGEESKFDVEWDELIGLKKEWKNEISNLKIWEKEKHMELDNRVCRALFVKKYPSNLRDTFITELSGVPFHSITTIDVAPIPKEAVQEKLMSTYMAIERSIEKQQQLRNKNHQFSSDISYDKKREKEETEEYLDEVRSNDQRMFYCGITILITAKDMEQLDSRTDTITTIGKSYNVQIEEHWLKQMAAMKTSLPVGGRYVKTMRSLFTQSLAVLMPFNVQELCDDKGIHYGVNQLSRNILIGERKKLINGNGFIFGVPGSGKSDYAKFIMMQEFLCQSENPDDIIVIDPQNEYFEIARELNGAVINFSTDTENYVNPLTLPEFISNKSAFIADKAQLMYSLCEQAMKGPINAKHRSIIDRCTRNLYKEVLHKKEKISPTMVDFYNVLLLQDQNIDEVRELVLSLEVFVEGSLNIFSHQSNVDEENRFTVYGIMDLGEDLRAMSMLIMMEAISLRIANNARKGKTTRVYIDELHVLTGKDFSAKRLEKLWKEVRKRGGFCTGLTQNLIDVLKNETTETMLANSEFIALFRQPALERDRLQTALDLSDEQLKYVTNSACGKGLLKFGDKLIPFDNFIDKKEFPLIYNLFNTNMHEKVAEKGEFFPSV